MLLYHNHRCYHSNEMMAHRNCNPILFLLVVFIPYSYIKFCMGYNCEKVVVYKYV